MKTSLDIANSNLLPSTRSSVHWNSSLQSAFCSSVSSSMASTTSMHIFTFLLLIELLHSFFNLVFPEINVVSKSCCHLTLLTFLATETFYILWSLICSSRLNFSALDAIKTRIEWISTRCCVMGALLWDTSLRYRFDSLLSSLRCRFNSLLSSLRCRLSGCKIYIPYGNTSYCTSELLTSE